MSESGDYSPGDWKGFDFTAARQTYDKHVGRGYDAVQIAKKSKTEIVPEKVSTDSKSPLIICCDVTGSMGDWPATIFSKLPYLDNECKEYLGKDYEISFAANGDMYDNLPLQVRPFSKGTDLKSQLMELEIEGGGSGPDWAHESYELAALYYARNADIPKAVRPIMIFISDEHFHKTINPSLASVGHVSLNGDLTAKKVFAELSEKFSVYVIRKPYPRHDDLINKEWADVIGEDHIAHLPSADRVVDVIFGILAKETNKIDYFKDEIEERQRPDQVKTVYKSLETIHASLPEKADDGTGKSVMITAIKGKKTKHLLP